MSQYDKDTICQGYDERCNGCIYERRWNSLIAKPTSERVQIQERMNFLDPWECANMNMTWKDTK